MKTKKDNPGVYLPPPLFYVAIFFISIGLQNYLPISKDFFENRACGYLCSVFIAFGAVSLLPALITFLKSRNTLITILPAKSLQQKGIYRISRNPMYVGLLFVYIGMAFLKGNWWTFMMIPLVMLVINQLVIIKEEQYLERAFGQPYLDYKNKVRRWL